MKHEENQIFLFVWSRGTIQMHNLFYLKVFYTIAIPEFQN